MDNRIFEADSEKQTELSKKLSTAAEDFSTKVEAIYGQIDGLGANKYWVGEDYDAFSTGTEAYRGALADLSKTMDMFSKHFANISTGTEELSSELINIVVNMTGSGCASLGANGIVIGASTNNNGSASNTGSSSNNTGGTTNGTTTPTENEQNTQETPTVSGSTENDGTGFSNTGEQPNEVQMDNGTSNDVSDSTGTNTSSGTSVTLKSGDEVSIDGSKYYVYGFTRRPNGEIVTMYADKEGKLYYQDSDRSIQQVLESYSVLQGQGDHVSTKTVTEHATINSVDDSHPFKFHEVPNPNPSSLKIGDLTIANSEDIIGSATFENGSVPSSVSVGDTSGTAYTNIDVNNTITTDGSILDSYNGNLNTVINGDNVVVATGMRDFGDYVTKNPDANIVIKIPQDQYVEWDSPSGGTGFVFDTDRSAVYLKWNATEQGYQIVDEYGNITNDRVFGLDGFNDVGGSSGGVWK